MTTLIGLVHLSRELDVSPSTLRRHLAEFGVEAVRLSDAPNTKVHYSAHDIAKWAQARGIPLGFLLDTPNQDMGVPVRSGRGTQSPLKNSHPGGM